MFTKLTAIGFVLLASLSASAQESSAASSSSGGLFAPIPKSNFVYAPPSSGGSFAPIPPSNAVYAPPTDGGSPDWLQVVPKPSSATSSLKKLSNVSGTSTQNGVKPHKPYTAKQLATMNDANKKAQAFTNEQIYYETQAEMLQGTYDALQTTQSLFLGNWMGVSSGFMHQEATSLNAMNHPAAAKVLNEVAHASDILGIFQSMYNLGQSTQTLSSAFNTSGVNLIKDSGLHAFSIDAASPIAKAWLNITEPAVEGIIDHFSNNNK